MDLVILGIASGCFVVVVTHIVVFLIGQNKANMELKNLRLEFESHKEQNRIFLSRIELGYDTLKSVLLNQNKILEPSSNEWILKVDNLEKKFEPARIKRIIDKDSNEECVYNVVSNEQIECKNYKDGELVSSVLMSKFGAPIRSISYDESGKVKLKKEYDLLGTEVVEGSN